MRSSSTQPPETEPTTCPSSRIATNAPTGRGAEPQVFTMVPRATCRPLLRQASAVRSTSISTLSMGKCYPNSAPSSGSVLDGNAGPMARRDLAHDGEPKAATRARGAPHAVKALEHARALLARDARPVVLDFEEGMAVAPPGAHGDAPAAMRIFERVVHQVGKGFAQEKRVAVNRRRFELEAKIDVARERLAHPRLGLASGDALEIHLRSQGARARFGARQGKELVGKARGADRRLMDLLELRAAGLRDRLGERELGVRLQAGERRAQLVRGIGEKALLLAARRRHFLEQAVEGTDQRPSFFRRPGGVDRPQ